MLNTVEIEVDSDTFWLLKLQFNAEANLTAYLLDISKLSLDNVTISGSVVTSASSMPNQLWIQLSNPVISALATYFTDYNTILTIMAQSGFATTRNRTSNVDVLTGQVKFTSKRLQHLNCPISFVHIFYSLN